MQNILFYMYIGTRVKQAYTKDNNILAFKYIANTETFDFVISVSF